MFCVTGLLLFMMVGMLLAYLFYGANSMALLENPNPSIPDSIGALKIFQICQAIGLFIVPGFLVAAYFSAKPFEYLGFKKVNSYTAFLSVLTIVAAFPAINLLSSLNDLVPLPQMMIEMEAKAQVLTKAFMQVNGTGGIILNIFMIAILPAVGEELIFRGILQKLFTELTGKAIWGILISATLFSAMHLQFKGFLPRFALGVLFSYLLIWTGSLWLPIIAHFINNLIAIIGYTLIYKGTLPPETESIGGFTLMWPLGIVSIIAVYGLLRVIKGEGLTIGKIE